MIEDQGSGKLRPKVCDCERIFFLLRQLLTQYATGKSLDNVKDQNQPATEHQRRFYFLHTP